MLREKYSKFVREIIVKILIYRGFQKIISLSLFIYSCLSVFIIPVRQIKM